MIYGNKFLPKEDKPNSIIEFGISSIVYDEYINIKSLLEKCNNKKFHILDNQI